MIHTNRIRKALQFAARKHHNQFRKETEQLPYITHPFSVALLLADAGADEDTIIAGLLHDTIEDTETNVQEIMDSFGERVSILVLAVSEPKTTSDGTIHDWKGRKSAYLGQLREAEDAAVLISMADKIDNIESELENSSLEKNEIYSPKHWYRKPEEYFWFHESVLEEARRRNIAGSLRDRLEKAHKEEVATHEGNAS